MCTDGCLLVHIPLLLKIKHFINFIRGPAPSLPSLRSFWGLPGGSLREGVTPYSVPCKKPPEKAFGWPRVVSDKPTLGPDTSAVLVVLSGRMVGACALALTAFPRRYVAIWGSAKCVGQARQMRGTSRCWGRILVLFRRFQLVRRSGRGRS